jgi:hypothetical protein
MQGCLTNGLTSNSSTGSFLDLFYFDIWSLNNPSGFVQTFNIRLFNVQSMNQKG